MKKIIILCLLTICALFNTYGQSPLDNLVTKKFDTWGVGFNLGVVSPNSDASDNKSAFNLFSPKLNYDLYLSKQFSHFLSLEAHYSGGKLGLEYSPYTFSSKIRQIDGRVRISFTNGQILSNYKRTQIYGFVGVGMINYKTSKFEGDSAVTINSDWVHVIPVGVGFKSKISNSASFNIEVGYNKVNTDMLDGLKVSGSEKDGYTSIRAGVQFTLGKKKKPLEWDEPLAYFKPSEEHSVDTVVLIKKEIKMIPDTNKNEIESMTIYYDIGDYLINGIYREDLHQILKQLNKYPESSIEIVSHCDSTGSEKTNSKIVVQRSRLVSDFFINNDIYPNRIRIFNYGPEFAKEQIISRDRKVIIDFIKN